MSQCHTWHFPQWLIKSMVFSLQFGRKKIFRLIDDYSIQSICQSMKNALKKKWSQNGSTLEPFWKTAPVGHENGSTLEPFQLHFFLSVWPIGQNGIPLTAGFRIRILEECGHYRVMTQIAERYCFTLQAVSLGVLFCKMPKTFPQGVLNANELIVVGTFYGILMMIRVHMWADNAFCQFVIWNDF